MNAKSPFRRIAAIVSVSGLCLLGLSSCTYVKSADVDKVTGPVGGSINGSEVSGAPRDEAILGGLLKRVNGDNIAALLNEEDQHLMGTLAFIVLEQEADEKVRTWRNRRTKHHGSFSVSSSWMTSADIECRRFTNMIYVENTESQANGTACRLQDGIWAVTG